MDPTSRRSAGIAGIVFVVLAVAVAILTGDANWDSSRREFLDFYDNNQQNMAVVAIGLLPFTIGAFLCFIAGLRSFLRAGDRAGGGLPSLAAIGGGVFGAALLVSVTTSNAVPAAMAFSDSYRLNAGVTQLMLMYAFVLGTGAVTGAAVLVAATSAAAKQNGLLPNWFVWSGYVVAVLGFLSLLLFGWPIALFGIWVLVTSVLMMRSPAPAGELPSPRAEPTESRETPKHDIPG